MTKLVKTGENSLIVSIEDEGASLSVHFACLKFHSLFGYQAYADPRYDEPRWVYVQDDPNRPRFTERYGRFAPYAKVRVRESDLGLHDEEKTLEFRFDPGSPYNKKLRVMT